MKKRILIIGAFGILAIAIARPPVAQQVGGLLRSLSLPATPRPYLRIGDTTVSVSLARTHIQQQRGLSNTVSLDENSGKLFMFQAAFRPAFWMKDMRYPIDIVWISDAWNVVDITENLAPQTYPLQVFPRADVRYVLEVNAGFVAAHGIEIGDSVIFEN